MTTKPRENQSKKVDPKETKEAKAPKAALRPQERSATWTAQDKEKFDRHVVNLRHGQFIDSGDYETTEAKVRQLFDAHLTEAHAQAQEEGRPLRLLFWAHGGLVGEKDALTHVLQYHAKWLSVGVYPIYFIWETDIGTTLRDLIKGRPAERGLLTDISDAALEFALRPLAKPVWGKMKEYAEDASKPNGGATFTAQRLVEFLKNVGKDEVELYAMGHSAGSIFHASFLPMAHRLGASFKELFLLAPAITSDEFKAKLLPKIGQGKGIDHCTMFTMTEEAERKDTVIKVYRKSLLYFVSRACEADNNTPILGLQEEILRDAVLRLHFAIDGNGTAAKIHWSPGSHTQSLTHGGFDNDSTTLNNMVRLITNGNATPFAAPTDRGRQAGASKKKALCIGIDEYERSPLFGCVNDANQWRGAFISLGFDTQIITNQEATYDNIVSSIRALISESQAGDHLVLQYAGHGTQVDDVDGDETDLTDEALVPIDFENGKFLIDDDLGELFDQLPAGVSLTCFMDCCHSGTNTRKLFGRGAAGGRAGERVRFLPIPKSIIAEHIKFRKQAGTRSVPNPFHTKAEVSFAACSPRQTAKEFDGHGYFTTTALSLLLDGAGQQTHAEFISAVRDAFPRDVDDQTPQLDCAAERKSTILLGPLDRAAPAAGTATTTEKASPDTRSPQSPIDLQMLNESLNLLIKAATR